MLAAIFDGRADDIVGNGLGFAASPMRDKAGTVGVEIAQRLAGVPSVIQLESGRLQGISRLSHQPDGYH